MWCWIFSALSLTSTAEIFLLPVGRSAVTHQCVTPAMRTMNDDGDHRAFNLVYSWYCYAIVSFSFLPLPFLHHRLKALTGRDPSPSEVSAYYFQMTEPQRFAVI